jgi:hypothetical protein
MLPRAAGVGDHEKLERFFDPGTFEAGSPPGEPLGARGARDRL